MSAYVGKVERSAIHMDKVDDMAFPPRSPCPGGPITLYAFVAQTVPPPKTTWLVAGNQVA